MESNEETNDTVAVGVAPEVTLVETEENNGIASEQTDFPEVSEEGVSTEDTDGQGEVNSPEEALDITIKTYRILGMVDYTDEQGNIVGQLKIGSVASLPAHVGDLAVEDGRAEEVQ